MNDEFTILVADRNKHVRDFLRRELTAEGYSVQVARDGREVLAAIDGDRPPDLLILDLDVPYVSGLTILERLQQRKPPIPVVIHSFLSDLAGSHTVQQRAVLVEKCGNTDLLKSAVQDVLKRFYPHRLLKVT